MPDIIVQRTWKTAKSTIGQLTFGNFNCFTLEDTERAPGVKVAGQTAIPAGRYEVQMTFSPRFQRNMPLVMGVPGFAGIRIHSGNTAEDTEGCLLLGYVRLQDRVEQSRAACQDFYVLLTKALSKGKVYILYQG